jgi:hypothetical protein
MLNIIAITPLVDITILVESPRRTRCKQNETAIPMPSNGKSNLNDREKQSLDKQPTMESPKSIYLFERSPIVCHRRRYFYSRVIAR